MNPDVVSQSSCSPIETFGTVNLDPGALAGSGTVTGLASRAVNGRQIVSIVFDNVPPSRQVPGHVAADRAQRI